ncbi:MAG: AAA family ATPase [Planctomycetota bacterium]|jgi:MoxR-like ATPase
MTNTDTTSNAERHAPLVAALKRNVSRVFLGKPEVLDAVLTGLLAGGHVLLEDVPGVGKTILAKSLARSIDCEFRRVQFTPDLLPSDIVGVAIYEQRAGAFEFKPGPIFTNVLLADEINRATPRTQSALLEAMNDAQVTVDRTSHPLPRPFFVIATQNPYEFEGTYSLPESQLDRFMLRVRIGYPSPGDEKSIILAQRTRHPIDDLASVLTAQDVDRLQTAVRQVRVADAILDYLVSFVGKTRSHKQLTVGVSPRGSVALSRAAQARALLHGRDYVLPDDVKALVIPVLAHRVLGTGFESEGGADDRPSILTELLDTVDVPL